MYFQRIICCCCVGLTRHRFDSPKSRLTNKNSSNRHTRGGYTVAHSLPNSSPPTTQTLLAVLAQTLTQPKPQTQLLLSHHSPHPTQPSAAETKSQWKRSTMETQIQQAPVTSSCREQRSAQQQQPPGSGTNRAAVECIMERPADGSSSPLCLSTTASVSGSAWKSNTSPVTRTIIPWSSVPSRCDVIPICPATGTDCESSWPSPRFAAGEMQFATACSTLYIYSHSQRDETCLHCRVGRFKVGTLST